MRNGKRFWRGNQSKINNIWNEFHSFRWLFVFNSNRWCDNVLRTLQFCCRLTSMLIEIANSFTINSVTKIFDENPSITWTPIGPFASFTSKTYHKFFHFEIHFHFRIDFLVAIWYRLLPKDYMYSTCPIIFAHLIMLERDLFRYCWDLHNLNSDILLFHTDFRIKKIIFGVNNIVSVCFNTFSLNQRPSNFGLLFFLLFLFWNEFLWFFCFLFSVCYCFSFSFISFTQ